MLPQRVRLDLGRRYPANTGSDVSVLADSERTKSIYVVPRQGERQRARICYRNEDWR